MKKYFYPSLFLGLILSTFAIPYNKSLLLKEVMQGGYQQLIQDATVDEMQNTYLKLFNDYKDSNQKLGINNAIDTHANFPKIKDPFAIPAKNQYENLFGKKYILQKNRPLKQNSLNLSGILWSDKKPAAVINEKIVHVDSNIGLFKVVQILPQKVVLSSRNNTVVLRLPINKYGKQ